MTAFNTIKAGDVLYDCRRQQMGNTTMSRMTCWTVKVGEIDTPQRRALCSWNGNQPTWWGERKLLTLRRTPIKSSR